MRRDEALALLGAHSAELKERFSVRSLSLFGSVAREEAREDSDIDVLVEFVRPASLFDFVLLRERLSEILGRAVDLSEPDALRPRFRERILAEAIRAT